MSGALVFFTAVYNLVAGSVTYHVGIYGAEFMIGYAVGGVFAMIVAHIFYMTIIPWSVVDEYRESELIAFESEGDSA